MEMFDLVVDVSHRTVLEIEREAAKHPPIEAAFFEMKGDKVLLHL